MKRLFPYLAVFVLAMLLTNAYYANRLSTHNVSTLSEIQGKYNSLHQRLSFVEENYTRRRTYRFWGHVSTDYGGITNLDSPINEMGSVTNTVFRVENFKGGPAIVPAIRIPAGTHQVREFEILLDEPKGKIVDAWVTFSRWDSDFSGFESLYIGETANTNHLKLVMQLKPGHSVKTRFDVVVLME